MTPEAIRTVTDIRQEFYTLLAKALGVPAHITKGNSYLGNTPKISWTDSCQNPNYVCIYAHIAPDVLVPDRPLILRLGLNQGLGLEPATGRKTSRPRTKKLLKFELTLLPNEVLQFAPWIVDLLHAYETGSDTELDPPCQINSHTLADLVTHGAWTHEATQKELKKRFSTTRKPRKMSSRPVNTSASYGTLENTPSNFLSPVIAETKELS
jgi:hypothetical protein